MISQTPINNQTALEAERSLVGAAMEDARVFTEAALKYSQFSDAKCQIAWKVIGKLLENGATLDPIAVADASDGRLTYPEVGAYVSNLGAPNAQGWTKIIREEFTRRGLAKLTSGLTGSPEEQLTKARQRLEDLENAAERSLPSLAELAASECVRIRSTPLQELRGLPTGLGIERVVPGGIPRGKVTTLFGESGNFKTTVKNNIVLGIASAGYRVLDVSLEDADELTAHRFIAGCTGLNYGRIAAQQLTESDRAKLVLPEKALIAANNVILAGEIWPNIDEVIRTARFYANKDGLAAVVIDYVQLLEANNPRWSEKEKLDYIMRKCQLAAKRDNIAYIIVSQVKQDVDQRTDHTPRITDMIGSSAMRTASKLSIGVYRPALYSKTPKKGSRYEKFVANYPGGKEVYQNMLELHFLKNVLGEPKVIVHCLVAPATGHIQPFDMRGYE